MMIPSFRCLRGVDRGVSAMAVTTGILTLSALTASPAVAQGASDAHVRIDQFGYRIHAEKVAVLREPLNGFDAPDPYTPGPTIEIRRSSDQSVAYQGAATSWNQGLEHAQSGDRVWWFDFTDLREAGRFYVFDPTNGIRSEDFEIGSNVYAAPLRDAVRMFYYQRCGVAKSVPYAEGGWQDAICHLGNEQDLDCRYVNSPTPASGLDLSGGWHDAGDYNKYINYADDALHNLLWAYEEYPHYWGDDLDLPESGNGIPDLLDEVRFELEWMLKMQHADGSVIHKLSGLAFGTASPPSADVTIRRYSQESASATISACAVYAHAASVYASLANGSSQAFAARLAKAARDAWNWLEANPGRIPSQYDNSGFGTASAEDDAYTQFANHLAAAVYLYAFSGDTSYRDFVETQYTQLHLIQWNWASPWESESHDAILLFTRLPGVDPAVASAIRDGFANSVSGGAHLGQFDNRVDAYRAWLGDGDHTWGSNRTKAREAGLYLQLARHGLIGDAGRRAASAAEGYLHYLFGLNPVGFSFLTNMQHAGAEGSVQETYHAWFAEGTVWDNATTSLYGPPPGYLTGGVNPSYRPDAAYTGPPIEPPMNQPILKSYRDWNTSWPQNSWEVTECHIPYQASFLRLLAAFHFGPPRLGLQIDSIQAGSTTRFDMGGADAGAWLALMWSFEHGRTVVSGKSAFCADLGLDLSSQGANQRVCLTRADGQGRADCSIRIPGAAAGRNLQLQAAQAGSCPEPIQSAVVTSFIR